MINNRVPHYLLASDFDGTIAMTFEQSPSGRGVHEVHLKVIEELWSETGLKAYEAIGGLRNRAPSELVRAMIAADNTLVPLSRESYSRLFYDDGNTQRPLWDENRLVSSIAELFVTRKMHHYAKEIGTQFPDGQVWPRPCKGFPEFWQTIRRLNTDGNFHIHTAIISSGHTAFIQQTFQLWELNGPNIMVTEDDIRWKKYPEEMGRRVKPAPLPLALAHQQWLRILDRTDGNFDIEHARQMRERMVYFGDDRERDGGLAAVGQIPFGEFNAANRQPMERNGDLFTFSDWTVVGKVLERSIAQLRQGEPCTDIFMTQHRLLESQSVGLGRRL